MALESTEVIADLAVVMIVALGMALVSYWLKQPFIVAYMIAGIIIGPYTPPFSLIQEPQVLALLAQLGVVFLLLAVGLEYPIARFRAVGRKAIVIALAQNLGAFAAGTGVGLAFGFTLVNALFVGLAVSVTSTIILSTIMQERRVLQEGTAGLILGVTIIEDIIVISLLGVVQSVALTGTVSPVNVAISIAIVVAFVGGTLLIGGRFIPRAIDAVASTRREDLLLIAVLGLAFALAFLAGYFGLAIATGAFLAGVLVAESQFRGLSRRLVSPLKEVFGAIFFVSVGALMNVTLLPDYIAPIVALILASFAAKLTLTYASSRAVRVPRSDARRTALCLSAGSGEMGLVIATAGAVAGVTASFVLPLVGAITIVTAFAAPYLVRYAWSPRFDPRPEGAPG